MSLKWIRSEAYFRTIPASPPRIRSFDTGSEHESVEMLIRSIKPKYTFSCQCIIMAYLKRVTPKPSQDLEEIHKKYEEYA